MPANDWLMLIALGAACGMIGQVLRLTVGLKKMSDRALAMGIGAEVLFRRGKLLISLLMGATAGALAAILTWNDASSLGSDELLALAAAGYAGADFIDGVMKRFVPAAIPAN